MFSPVFLAFLWTLGVAGERGGVGTVQFMAPLSLFRISLPAVYI